MNLLPPPPTPLETLAAAVVVLALTLIGAALLHWVENKNKAATEANARARREHKRSEALQDDLYDERRRRMELAEENARLRRARPDLGGNANARKEGDRR